MCLDFIQILLNKLITVPDEGVVAPKDVELSKLLA